MRPCPTQICPQISTRSVFSNCSAGSYDSQPPPPAALGAMMLSFACRSLSRHGELMLKGSGPRLRRGSAPRRRRGPVCRSVLEETALSWVTSCLQRAGGGEAEEARWLGVDAGVFREQIGDVWSHLRWVEEYETARGSSTSEEQSDTREGGGGNEEAPLWCCCRENKRTNCKTQIHHGIH